MDNRRTVVDTVRENPGITFTELRNSTGLATGTVQYHIRKSDKVVQRKSAVLTGEVCGNCELSHLCGDKCIQSILRDPLKKGILQGLDEDKAKKDIAEELDIHPSTLSYHVNSMRSQSLLNEDDKPKDEIRDKI